jgi:hypothetical protein
MLYPSFQIFDAPSREFCSVNRPRTNTPLQALVTLNDPAFVEAARVFAQRVLSRKEDSDQQRLRLAFIMATSRAPTDSEIRILTDTLSEQRKEFNAHPERASEFITNGKSLPSSDYDPVELAAWTSLGSILLNLDETISRE